jgi:hypothetical protein
MVLKQRVIVSNTDPLGERSHPSEPLIAVSQTRERKLDLMDHVLGSAQSSFGDGKPCERGVELAVLSNVENATIVSFSELAA